MILTSIILILTSIDSFFGFLPLSIMTGLLLSALSSMLSSYRVGRDEFLDISSWLSHIGFLFMFHSIIAALWLLGSFRGWMVIIEAVI